MSPPQAPMVGIVVVHYGQPDRTAACLDALGRLTWPPNRRRVVVVDNGSDASFGSRTRSTHPWVSIVRSGSNIGFPAACNAGIASVGDVDHIALLNNDALPDPAWLEPLVATATSTCAGAVTPKVLLAGRHVTVDLTLQPRPSPPGDWRSLGVQLSGVKIAGREVTSSIRLVSGFWGWEHDAESIGGRFAWSREQARAQLPVADDEVGGRLAVRLSSPAGTVAVSATVERRTVEIDVDERPRWYDVGAVTSPEDVVNNAGTVLLADGSSRDRGFLEPDRGQFDVPETVFGWSGTAVLLSKRMLADVGGFDERLFLFYEDTDLSLRGRLRGWTYRYEPTSVVRHAHAASVGEDSALSRHLTTRNRVLVLAKVAPRPVAMAALFGQLEVARAAALNDVVGRVRRRTRPRVRHLADEVRILVGIVERLPGSWRRRRSVLRRAVTSPEELWRETLGAPQTARRSSTTISQVRGRV